MPTNRRRKPRTAKKRIAANITEKYLKGLDARDFLADCTGDIYNDALNADEAKLLREYKDCDRDFEKWQKMKKGA